jgi:hypothetical protein
MTTETINGLHSCKPGNEPQLGQVKLMVVQHMTSKKNGKPYLKIKNANAENGGTPHRILSAEPTGFTDQNGNISFNIEVEPSSSPPTAFANARATMQQGEDRNDVIRSQVNEAIEMKEWADRAANEPQSPPHAQQGEDGVTATRKHLMQTSNLMVLCIKAADYVALQLPEVAHTSEQFAGILGQLFKEAYSRRTTDGVNWWSYSDLMPDKPLPVNGGKHAATVKPIQKEEEPF